MSLDLRQGDALGVLREMPGASVHCAVTSPPYWSLRDYGVPGQLGLEKVHDCLGWATGAKCGACYICRMVELFRELRRVLRDDGTLWVNEGDSYTSGGRNGHGTRVGYKQETNRGANDETSCERAPQPVGLKPKDLCGIPWRLALALQADGWYWRDAIVWAKPAPMPESVRDRCTKSWEPILMFSKSERYYFDGLAIAERLTRPDEAGRTTPNKFGGANKFERAKEQSRLHSGNEYTGTDTGTRNKRNVWRLPPMPVSDAHFATFPLELPETCLLAGTSERGVCPTCGAPWCRIVERKHHGDWHPDHPEAKQAGVNRDGKNRRFLESQAAGRRMVEHVAEARATGADHDNPFAAPVTLGWRPSCDCGGDPVPATVLDPFAGTGTTGLAALKHGRNFVGVEMSAEYIEIARKRAARHMPLLAV